MVSHPAFLRIPPFPGTRADALAIPAEAGEPSDLEALARQLAAAAVGGMFWGSRVELPARRDVILAPASSAQASKMTQHARREGYAERCVLVGGYRGRGGIPAMLGGLDPWHLLGQAARIEADEGHETALVAALLGVEVIVRGRAWTRDDCLGALDRAVCGFAYRSPFTGACITPAEAIALLADWRTLIDANRPVSAILGIARWKRVTMDALLWDGVAVRHAGPSVAQRLRPGDRAIAWKSRTPASVLAALDARGVALGEIEDGMIRSTGLGANCVPPLSVIVDPEGAHFDPRQPSALETILQHSSVTAALCERAARLRRGLVAAGISKYGRDAAGVGGGKRLAGGRRRVLVTGQVEDDRSVILGGAGLTNHALLARARALEPEAHLIYKPHPDVEAGHRKGRIRPADALVLADEIDATSSINALLDSVDALHVITSLAGFEALMRGVEVTTHGVPFYAGWGLTTDLGPVPDRRTRERTLDELVAATLILYPRYLDPVTQLPCPVEILVRRLSANQAQIASPLIALRKLQGRFNRMFRGA